MTTYNDLVELQGAKALGPIDRNASGNPYIADLQKMYGMTDEDTADFLSGMSIFDFISKKKHFDIENMDDMNELMEQPMFRHRLFHRQILIRKYAWAIPNEHAIKKIVKFGPIVDFAAGNGYWSWMIQKHGGQAVAIDRKVPQQPELLNKQSWVDIVKGGPKKIASYPDHTLMLCWPPYGTSLAYTALKRYKGQHVIYVGEGSGGCTGCDDFHELLEHDFDLLETIKIPQYPGIHDRVYIYRRK